MKTNFLTLTANHTNVKRLANMSSKDKNYNPTTRAYAQYLLLNHDEVSDHFMWLLNIAYYVYKHHLNTPENFLKFADYIKNARKSCNKYNHDSEYIRKNVHDIIKKYSDSNCVVAEKTII